MAVLLQAQTEGLVGKERVRAMSEAELDRYVRDRMYVPNYTTLVHKEESKEN